MNHVNDRFLSRNSPSVRFRSSRVPLVTSPHLPAVPHSTRHTRLLTLASVPHSIRHPSPSHSPRLAGSAAPSGRKRDEGEWEGMEK